MYVKVYIENNQLFREDNGNLIGEAVFPLPDPTFSIYECNNQKVSLIYGYKDSSDSFIKLCRGTNCSFQCLSERKPECRYCSKSPSEGLYVEL